MKDFKVYQASGYLTKLVTDSSDVRKVYEEISGSLVQFDTPISAPLESLIVDINPVQDLHGQDAPYPAGGGKNKILISPDTLVRSNGSPAIEYGADNSFTIKSDRVLAYDACFAVVVITEDMVGQTYTISADEFKLTYPRISKSLESGGTYSTPEDLTRGSQRTYTITQDDVGYTLLVRGYNDTGADLTWNKIQLEFGSSATSFAPYENICPITGWTGANIYHSGEDTSNPTVYTVSWQDEEGTVYGGTVDVTSGLLTINKNILAFNSLTWTWDQQYSRFISNAVSDVVQGQSARWIPSICSAFPVISDGRTIGNVPDNSVYWADTINSFQLCVKTSLWTTPSDFLDDMGNETIVYPINTPIEIQITPEEINTLIGVNNIWADTGNVSVKYRTH